MMPTQRAYTPHELDALAPVLEEARALWRDRCAATFSRSGDVGTCVLGAGIAVYVRPPRTRVPRRRIVIPAEDVTRAQGASVWEESVHEVIAVLAERGVVAEYHPGAID
jgi:hypothetical protein